MSAPFSHFFCFSDAFELLLGKDNEQIAKNMDFGFPKLSPNPSKSLPKSVALLAAPGVSDPAAFDACINMLHFLTRGGQTLQNPVGSGLCWGHVGLIFGSGTPFFRCWPLPMHFLNTLGPSWSFFDFLVALDSILQALGQFLEPSKLHFSMFLGACQHNHRNALHATKPQFLQCFIRFGPCRTKLLNVLSL